MNKKGFVLIETLVVTIFTLVTFTILYNSAIPLLGKYKELSYYDTLDLTYDLYHIRNLIRADSKYEELINSHYESITCSNNSLSDQSSCKELFKVLEIDETEGDELLFLNTNYIEEFKNDTTISNDIKNYLDYIDVSGRIFLLQNEGYVSYLNLMTPSEKIINSITNSVKNSMGNSVCNPSITDDDGTIYLSGTNECVDFNYVWYSGKLWRITSINPDGTMKMVTDETISTISYGSDVNFYTDENNKSYVYQWLNEEFLDTLYNYENIIVTDYKWNATPTTNFSTKLPKTTMIEAEVGLLNSYEYYMSYQNADYTNGYLNIGNSHWLLNSYDSSNVFVGYYKGQIEKRSPIEYMRGVRPSIKLKSNIQLKGEGTIDNPYKISGDKERVITNTTLLNTRTSGEYVSFDNELYRIVNIESNGSIKINKVDYLSGSKYFASTKTYGATSNTQSNDYWDYYLNNTWYNNISSEYKNMLVKGTYYLGLMDPATNYKASICKEASNTISIKNCEKTSSTWEGYVGLPRAGEMFASQLIKSSLAADFILITPALPSHILHIISSNNININSVKTVNATVRPSLTISKEVVIKEGLGTKNNPYEIILP